MKKWTWRCSRGRDLWAASSRRENVCDSPGPEALEDEQEGVVVLCHRVAAGHRGAGTSLEAGGAWYWGAVGAVAAAEGVGRERRRASRHLQDNPLGQRHAPGSEHFAGEDKRRVLAQTLALAKRRE